MRFLNPKTYIAFRKVFGSDACRNIPISFLNAILDLTAEDAIADVTILDPDIVYQNRSMRDIDLDLLVKDGRGRSYNVEMRAQNVKGLETQALINGCLATESQIGTDDPRPPLLTKVVAVIITDFVMFPERKQMVNRFHLRAEENPLVTRSDLDLLIAELPKLTINENELVTSVDRWLYFLKAAGRMTAIPEALAMEPAIVKALQLVNRANWTEGEYNDQINREMWISDHQYIQRLPQAVEQRSKMVGGFQKIDRPKDLDDGRAVGIQIGKTGMLLRLLRHRFGPLSSEVENRIFAANSDRLDDWSERLLDARELADVFDAPTTH